MTYPRAHGYHVVILASTLAFENDRNQNWNNTKQNDNLLANYLESAGVEIVPGRIRNRDAQLLRLSLH